MEDFEVCIERIEGINLFEEFAILIHFLISKPHIILLKGWKF